MPLQTSGAISLQNIATEFGGSQPHSLNEYYAGGGLVLGGTTGTNGAVPSSGSISMSSFYGTSSVIPPNLNQWYYNDSTKVLKFRHQVFGPNTGGNYGPFSSSFEAPSTTVYHDASGWLTDTGSQLYYTLLRWCDHVTIESYYVPTSCQRIEIRAWGGGGGAGGVWNASGSNTPPIGGAGGYAYGIWPTGSGSSYINTGQWVHTVSGHAGAGGPDAFYSGYGAGASFAWTTASAIAGLSNYDKIQTLNTSNLLLVAGGGGGAGAQNVYYSTNSYGGSGGSTNSGSNGSSVSGSGSGATTTSNGTQSIGPYSGSLLAGAPGGAIGYATSSMTFLGESHPRNLIVTVVQTIAATDDDMFSSAFAFPSGGGGGVYMGACGTTHKDGTYGYASRGAGGGSSKFYSSNKSPNSGGTESSGGSPYPPSEENSKGRGGVGSYSSSGSNLSGNNGTPGRVRIIFYNY